MDRSRELNKVFVLETTESDCICIRTLLLYLAYGSKEKINTGWKFLNNYSHKREQQGDKVKNQLYKFVAYYIKCKSESRWVWESWVHVPSRML